MREERASNASFEFLDYQSNLNQPSTSSRDLSVTHDGFWSYCGSLITNSQDMPPDFHEFTSSVLSDTLLPRLTPFLDFVNQVLRDHGLDHYWLTIRATKATSEFDKPRWHTDEQFFSSQGGGLRMMTPREGDEGEGKRQLDLQTDWKLCATLLGPSTKFIPAKHQDEARRVHLATRKALQTEHDCTSIRCVACAATSDAVRERLAVEFERLGALQAASTECVFFRIGQKQGAVHSEPCMSDGDRIFVNVVPGTRDELKNLVSRWGMSFPRSWWIAPGVSRGRGTSS
ncbi:hypothetical protein GGS20DRAFT_201065 [Poronia punctata]|nr:hypothetical protein GGS20DRAFT_201065 [Poronia punctata]